MSERKKLECPGIEKYKTLTAWDFLFVFTVIKEECSILFKFYENRWNIMQILQHCRKFFKLWRFSRDVEHSSNIYLESCYLNLNHFSHEASRFFKVWNRCNLEQFFRIVQNSIHHIHYNGTKLIAFRTVNRRLQRCSAMTYYANWILIVNNWYLKKKRIYVDSYNMRIDTRF